MRVRLLAATVIFAALFLLVAPSLASASDFAKGEPVLLPKGRLGEPPIDDGGGYGGCWYFPASYGESHWYGSWNQVFRPIWCGNGYAITYVDPSYHYQSASGLYGTEGINHFRTAGCVGCATISYHALANFSFNSGGWTSHMTRDIWITLYPSSGAVVWSHD